MNVCAKAYILDFLLLVISLVRTNSNKTLNGIPFFMNAMYCVLRINFSFLGERFCVHVRYDYI